VRAGGPVEQGAGSREQGAIAAGSAAASLSLARLAAAPPPMSAASARIKPCRQELFSLQSGEILTIGNASSARETNRTLASLWTDGGLRSTKVKEEREARRAWRAEHVAFVRARGLRRELIESMHEWNAKRESKATQDHQAHSHRMRLWKIEDDAVLRVQDAWRRRCARRTEVVGLNATLKMQAMQRSGHGLRSKSERDRLSERARMRRMRERAARRAGQYAPPDSRTRGGHTAVGTTASGKAEVKVEATAVSEEALERKMRWTEGVGLQEVSDTLEAGLEPLLAQLKGKLASLDGTEGAEVCG